jgi:hypothetical protein
MKTLQLRLLKLDEYQASSGICLEYAKTIIPAGDEVHPLFR